MEQRLAQFKDALRTTYDEKTASEITEQAKKDGFVNETQRRFGLHYVAHEMYEDGKKIMQMMKKNGLENFEALYKDKK